MNQVLFGIPSTAALCIVALSLAALYLTAHVPYERVAKIIGRPWLASLAGLAALAALLIHIAPHVREYVENSSGTPTLTSYAAAAWPFLLIALAAFWIDSIYHSHEAEHDHAEHCTPAGRAGQTSGVVRLVVLAIHAFLDGHVLASLGFNWLALPFVYHKAFDGLVINGERTTHAATTAWRWRIWIQFVATLLGSFLILSKLPESIHIGLVAAVIGLYAGSLRNYVRERAKLHDAALAPVQDSI